MVDKIWNDRKGYLLRSHLISQPTSVDYSCIYKPYPKVANCAVHLWLWVSSRLKGVWSWGGVPVTRDVTCPSAPPFFACSLLLAHEFVNLSPPHVGSWAVHESTVLWTGWRLVFLSQVTISTLVGWGEVRREADLEEGEKNKECVVWVLGVRELRRGVHTLGSYNPIGYNASRSLVSVSDPKPQSWSQTQNHSLSPRPTTTVLVPDPKPPPAQPQYHTFPHTSY